MKEEILNKYMENGNIDIDKIIEEFYGYVYTIVNNSVSSSITDEDVEEIISDVFVAIWKNSNNLLKTTPIKPYLAGITKNVIRNKYRGTQICFSIYDYEESLVDNTNIDKILEENDQEKIIQSTIKKLKNDEYKIFVLFYYNAKSIKEIADMLNFSISKVKTTLHRIRKIIKINLEKGDYIYGKR